MIRNLGENPFRASSHTIYQNRFRWIRIKYVLKQTIKKLELDIHRISEERESFYNQQLEKSQRKSSMNLYSGNCFLNFACYKNIRQIKYSV